MDFIFRITTSMYGQEFLVGMNWDLLPLFFGAGAAFVIVHMLYMHFWAPKVKEH